MILQNLKIKSLTAIFRHTPDQMQWHVQNRKTHIIGIQLRGNMYHEIGNSTITLTAGSLFFFNQKDDFHAVVKELGESYTIHFTTYEPIEADSFAVKGGSIPEAVSMLEKTEHFCNPQYQDTTLAMIHFYRFCHLLETLYTQCYHPSDSRMTAAKAHLDLHFRERDALADAVQLAGLSRRRFNDLFKVHYSITPSRYLTTLKIATAKKLICSSLPIKKAAEISGFEDYYYFNKVFKAETGLTPFQFKKNHM